MDDDDNCELKTSGEKPFKNEFEGETNKKLKTENLKSEEHSIKKEIKTEEMSEAVECKPTQVEQPKDNDDDDDKLLVDYMVKEEAKLSQSSSPSKLDSDYYLKNFTHAIESILNQTIFGGLFDQADYDVIKRFSLLSSRNSFYFE